MNNKKRTGLLLFLFLLLAASCAFGLSPNSTMGKAASIQLNQSCQSNLEKFNDRQYYRFVLNEPGFVSVSFTHEYLDDYGYYWTTEVMNEDENIFQSVSQAAKDEGETRSGNIGLPAGTYYLLIKSGGTLYSLEPYTFRINFTPSANWETEPNDRMAIANPVRLNEGYTAAFQQENRDKDYYSFTLPADGYIQIQSDHEYADEGTGYWSYKVMAADENIFYSCDTSGEDADVKLSPHIGLPAGTYYLYYYPSPTFGADTVDYRFTIFYTRTDQFEREMNDNAHFANPITLGQGITGATIYYNDKDFYKITTTEAGQFHIQFRHPYVNESSYAWGLSITNSDKQKIFSTGIPGSEESFSTVTDMMAPGTWYFQISCGYDSSTADYTLTVTTARDDGASGEQAAERWICLECGKENDGKFCLYCGAPKPAEIVCPGCGKVYPPDTNAVFCGECGTKIR